MKIIAPSYYEKFTCKMGSCIHTCCSGWQVDIDKDTLDFYDSLKKEDRQWVKSFIKENEGVSFFERRKDGRCPFLRDDGLCEMIIRLGPDALCDNCLDHPLFRNYYSDRVEIGLGICCESACSLILNQSDPIEFLIAEEGDDVPLSLDDEKFFLLRDELISIAQDRSKTVVSRVSEISEKSGFSISDMNKFIKFISSLEHLDSEWSELLKITDDNFTVQNISDNLEIPFEQYMVCIIYRNAHFNVDYAISLIHLCLYLISCNPEKSIEEIARLISSEIEYSDQNPEMIVEYLQNQ